MMSGPSDDQDRAEHGQCDQGVPPAPTPPAVAGADDVRARRRVQGLEIEPLDIAVTGHRTIMTRRANNCPCRSQAGGPTDSRAIRVGRNTLRRLRLPSSTARTVRCTTVSTSSSIDQWNVDSGGVRTRETGRSS